MINQSNASSVSVSVSYGSAAGSGETAVVTLTDGLTQAASSSQAVPAAEPLGRQVPKMPPGCLIMTDTSGARLDPVWSNDLQRSDLGDRVILDYFESAELPVRG